MSGGVAVALLRHFPTDWNRARRLQGRTDRPLTAEARATLAGLAPPPPWDRARVIASPLARARDTATALWPAVETDARLMELDYGGWEGRSIDALLADPDSGYVSFDRWGWDRRAPGGESPADARARVAPLLAELAADGRPALLVAHRGLMRAILAAAHGWDYDRPEPFAIKRGRLHLVTLDATGRPAPGPTLRLTPR
jgi:probable phosphoglycerate mutase